ncbi:NADH-cytochrome b5 reductase [Linnemannia schmuckeri]|uniref:cytochrome-b5 reductase n=1 Tax=Linnemannia schmuckeri TaxID=64567 RepID=A0A9P5VE89_9FUNG|nr:NADH-cytochrome b5 reductase [Linnemannia schmuckeri]
MFRLSTCSRGAKTASSLFNTSTASTSTSTSHIHPIAAQIRCYARPPKPSSFQHQQPAAQKTTFNSTSSTTARAPKASTTSNIITFLAASSIGIGAYLYQWNQHRSSSGVLSSNPFFDFFSSSPETLTTEKWTPIQLTKITNVSEHTSLFEFRLPAPCTIPISSAIYVKDDQIQAMRAYTPVHSTESEQGTVQLLIKRYSEGQVSRFMHDAKEGQKIEMRGPVLIWPGGREDLKQWDEIGMIAGGTGITAFMPIIHSALTNSDKKIKISLLFASQSPEELYFKDELDYLVKTFPDQLRVSYTVDKVPATAETTTAAAPSKWEGHVGYVTQGMLQGLLPPPKKAITQGDVSGSQDKEQEKAGSEEKKSIVLVCGPESMVNHVAGTRGMSGQEPIRGVLGAMGYQRDQVFRFPN